MEKTEKQLVASRWRVVEGSPQFRLNSARPLYRLADVVNWGQFERQFGQFSAEMGRPALATRLLVGLHYLKCLSNVSDGGVVASWVENPYWQYFCGIDYFVHEFPCNPSSLVKWRQRVGVEGSEPMLKESLAAAQREAVLSPAEMKRVNVDTTVQEKAVAFPTDTRLYHKARHRQSETNKNLFRKEGDSARMIFTSLSVCMVNTLQVSTKLLAGPILVPFLGLQMSVR